ncbi:MAG TPA: cytochrome c [Rhodopila sp.]|nr:cytochrome c [Rhodopila sp.]
MTSKITLCAIGLLAMTGMALPNMARADGLDPIAIRQVGMDLANGNFAFIKTVVKANGDVKPLAEPAKALARWGKTIPVVFPAGSDTGENTKAKPAIWSDRAGFEKAATAMQDAALKLADAAKAGDSAAVAADTKTLGESCGTCHRHYKTK